MELLLKLFPPFVYIIGLIGVAAVDHFKIRSLEERLDKSENMHKTLDEKLDKINESVIRLQVIIERSIDNER